MVHRNEADLVQRAVSGDRVALSTLLERHQQRLYNIVLRMLVRPEDAADVTQEALFKVVQHIGDYHGRSSLGTWMVRIAMNLALTHLRRMRTQGAASLDAVTDEGAKPLYAAMAESREPDPAQSVEDKEEVVRVLAAMGRLETDLRAVLTLRDIDEMSDDDMATGLGVPVGTVKSRLFRARLALRQEVLAGPGNAGGLPERAAQRAAEGPTPWEGQA